MAEHQRITVGGYPALRLKEAGLKDYFAIPGDYKLILLDELLKAASACAEHLPIVFVSGAPNTNAVAENHLMHHTLGKVDYDYVREMFSHVTADAVTVQHHDDAAQKIDHAVGQVLFHKKPVYIELACNVAALVVTASTCPLVIPEGAVLFDQLREQRLSMGA